MSSRSTVRTIERGVRIGNKSLSTTNLASDGNRSSSPVEHVKQQLSAFVDHSHLEKDEMSKLNDRLGAYVNRVKMLENENGRLLRDINERQASWGEETRRVREQLEPALFEVRGQIDEVAGAKTVADVRNKRAQLENMEYQRKWDETVRALTGDKHKVANLERELEQLAETKALMDRSLHDAVGDLQKCRQNRDDTWANLAELWDKLDDELYKRISVEYNNQTLREHLEFVKQVNEKELAEMSQLANILPFNDQVEFYKDQLKRVISNIRADYETLSVEQQRQMEEWVRVKTEELECRARQQEPVHELEMSIQIENLEQLRDTYEQNGKELDGLRMSYDAMAKRLHDLQDHVDESRAHLAHTVHKQDAEIKDLNEEMKGLLDDYNHISSHKANLEYEMHVYKRLLDSQLGRLEARQPEVSAKPENNQTIVSSNQLGGKVQNKKEKKGSVGICDTSPDGKYVAIENTGSGSGPVDLSGWTLRRRVDSSAEIVFRIPHGVLIYPNRELVVWADSYRAQTGPSDVIADFDNWGIGINSTTRLINPSNEEKSSFSQQISFSSAY